jgi:hypothetical protein
MLTTKEGRPANRILRGWAIAALSEARATQECEEHGWMQDRADLHARQRAFAIARQDQPSGVSPEATAVAIAEVLDSIGDTCPECLTEPCFLRGPRLRRVANSGSVVAPHRFAATATISRGPMASSAVASG